ncbi:glycosyl transferase [Acrocarpospora phusangensis]|uniref:Glycosyl transferase n=1 Tax=Acrocarpospora phusangensis TaxID=1070424 RepID=A0A919QGD4_9ACTN|nr:glycosyltransferase family 4 protein [Acrocarpospora phusangensis]GIH28313.1 glycosyl transferase [Acrocarpospora phusangensis]
MRIVLVLGTSSGGVGRHVRTLARGLVAAGHEVLVAGPPATESAFGFTGTGAAFAALPVSDRPHPVNDLRSVLALRRLTGGADVVHAHGLRAGALAGLAGGRGELVVTLHNALTAGGAIGAMYGVLERVVARRADRILVVSPDLGERMRRLGARRVAAAVVPAPEFAGARRPAAEVRAELGEGAVVLTVARLAQQKGLEVLLEAASGAYPEKVLFAVAGEGPLRAGLEERIAGRGLPVRLLGDRGDVGDLLGVASVYVVPSWWEGQPLTVQEALRAGVPIVATRVGGIPDMVGDAALLVPPGDAGAIRDAVVRVLTEPGLAERLRRAAAERGERLPAESDAVGAVLSAYGDHAGT